MSSSIFDRGEVKKEEKNELNSSALWDAVLPLRLRTIFVTLCLYNDDILTYGSSVEFCVEL